MVLTGQYPRNHFILLGVTWIGCHGIAPFEIDVELHPDDDIRLAKTLLRIGMLDELGQPCLSDRTRAPHHVLQNRPRRNQDWAMAVELTPPPQSEAQPPPTPKPH